MTNNFQQCSHLEILDEYSKLKESGHDALAFLFEMQKQIQEKVYSHDFNKIRESIRSLKSFIDWNEEAIRDEDREFQQALTGIHSYPGCWKPWKNKHNEALDRPFSDLTEDELRELHYEWIDKLHFMFNIAIAINLTPELITNYYSAKNKENRERQSRGY
jgi:hypothetical protein